MDEGAAQYVPIDVGNVRVLDEIFAFREPPNTLAPTTAPFNGSVQTFQQPTNTTVSSWDSSSNSWKYKKMIVEWNFVSGWGNYEYGDYNSYNRYSRPWRGMLAIVYDRCGTRDQVTGQYIAPKVSDVFANVFQIPGDDTVFVESVDNNSPTGFQDPTTFERFVVLDQRYVNCDPGQFPVNTTKQSWTNPVLSNTVAVGDTAVNYARVDNWQWGFDYIPETGACLGNATYTDFGSNIVDDDPTPYFRVPHNLTIDNPSTNLAYFGQNGIHGTVVQATVQPTVVVEGCAFPAGVGSITVPTSVSTMPSTVLSSGSGIIGPNYNGFTAGQAPKMQFVDKRVKIAGNCPPPPAASSLMRAPERTYSTDLLQVPKNYLGKDEGSGVFEVNMQDLPGVASGKYHSSGGTGGDETDTGSIHVMYFSFGNYRDYDHTLVNILGNIPLLTLRCRMIVEPSGTKGKKQSTRVKQPRIYKKQKN